MPKKISITKKQARLFLVNYHGLTSSNNYIGKEGVLSYIKKVGCIQFDPLDVVGRNPDLVLQSRINDYEKRMLENLLYEDRLLIDGWDKMMAIYHVEDWPKMSYVREAHSQENIDVMKHRGTTEAFEYLDKVKELIKIEGPKYSREISFGGGTKGRWSSNKYSNVALDHLFCLGELGISRKSGTQKQYDLIENILPKSLLESEEAFGSEADFYKWYILRRIRSIGLVWNKNGGAWLGHFISKKKLRTEVIENLVKEELICPVTVEGIKETFYVHRDDVEDLVKEYDTENNVRFLAPLDNLLWDRDLVKAVFDFQYSWEVYIPIAKRKYGYYVLPVLCGDQIIARFEPNKEDKKDDFDISHWWWEEDVVVTNEQITAIMEAFEKFGLFMKREIKYDSILSKVSGRRA